MRTLLGGTIAGVAMLGMSVAALAAAPPTRVRGTIESIKGNTVTVHDYDGHAVAVMLQHGTHYAWIVRSSLAHIKPGDFIGTAATGPDSALVAQEVVIFPAAMRGAGEGHYPWSMPDAIARADAGGAPPRAGGTETMTNGTVTTAGPVHGTMTNGTVSTAATAAGGKELTVTYDKGQKVQVMVPPTVPVVRFVPAHRSILKPGEKVFIVAVTPEGSTHLAANFVGVGKHGLTPPM